MSAASRDLYSIVLELPPPWQVTDVTVLKHRRQAHVAVDLDEPGELPCPSCGAASSRYDCRQRLWRHLDTCQYQTIVVCSVPRVRCAEHGVLQIPVPWAESGSRFPALFEAQVIDWLLEASIAAVARQLDLSWEQVDGIPQRAVTRGLARRVYRAPRRIGVDETSFPKRHESVTVVIDLLAGEVQYVADSRRETSLDGYFSAFRAEEREGIEAIAMDMWAPYIQAVQAWVPDAEKKICFDKFHVAKHLGDAVDKIRRQEHRKLRDEGDESLKGTKYLWLQHPDNMSEGRWNDFESLRESALKTPRGWALKETAMTLWGYVTRGWARRAGKKWLSWALRSRLEPMRKVAGMIRTHLEGILNAVVKKATNARSESVNAKIQWIKRTACGFRNRERFRTAIYFHCGGLDLYPELNKTAPR